MCYLAPEIHDNIFYCDYAQDFSVTQWLLTASVHKLTLLLPAIFIIPWSLAFAHGSTISMPWTAYFLSLFMTTPSTMPFFWAFTNSTVLASIIYYRGIFATTREHPCQCTSTTESNTTLSTPLTRLIENKQNKTKQNKTNQGLTQLV